MKITKISGEKIITLKPHQTNKKYQNTNIITNQNRQEKTSLPPKYYQAINSISFGKNNNFYFAAPSYDKNGKMHSLKFHIPFGDEESPRLVMQEKEVPYFQDENGYPDNKTIQFYIGLFKDYYGARRQKFAKDRDYLIDVLKGKEDKNIDSICPQENLSFALESANEAQDEDYLQTLIGNIHNPEQKKEMASRQMEIVRMNYIKSAITCAREAFYVLKLSKTEDGIDDSNLDIKRDIAILTANYVEDTGEECLDTIIEYSKDENGEFNLEVCYYISRLLLNILNQDTAESQIKLTSNCVKEIIKKDPQNYQKAMDALMEVQDKGGIDISQSEDDFKCFLNCFNPKTGKFDQKAFEKLKELFEATGTWWNENNADEIEDSYRTFSMVFRDICLVLIDEYFNESRNQFDGKIMDDAPNPFEFISNRGDNYIEENFTILTELD